MDSNATESGSRVTRSLRKRLTSVDSENSSRPGTPVQSKLISIPEISASPSRSTRMTRRNSTSGVGTPVKTPAKRGAASSAVIVENAETITPAKRNTRRRSVSVYENEESFQTAFKTPTFASLDEEMVSSEQNPSRVTRSHSKSPQQIKNLNQNKNLELEKENKSIRSLQIKLSKVTSSPKNDQPLDENNRPESENDFASRETRSQSKTPQQIQSSETSPNSIHSKSFKENKNIEFEGQNIKTNMQKQKPGPKSKTCKSMEIQNVSDIEIDVFENEMDNIKNKSSNITTIVLTDDESNQTVFLKSEENKTTQENIESNSESINVAQKDLKSIDELQNGSVSKNIVNEILKEPIDNKNVHEKNGLEILPQTVEILNDDKQIRNIDKDKEMSIQYSCDVRTSQKNEISSTSTTKVKEFQKYTSEVNFSYIRDCTSLQAKEESISIDKLEILSADTLTPYLRNEGEDLNVSDSKATSKKVDFISSPLNDMSVKNVYPKTPASVKLKSSFIVINSSQDNGAFQAENITAHMDNHDSSSGSENNEIVINTEELDDKQLDTNDQSKPNTTPIRTFKCSRSLEIVQSSTPIYIKAVNDGEPLPEGKKLIKDEDNPSNETMESLNVEVEDDEESKSNSNKMMAIGKDSPENRNEEELKWINPSVKGITVEGSKLDTVVLPSNTNTTANDCSNSADSIEEKVEKTNKKKSIIFSPDDQDGDSEQYKRKHDFLDDEAVEVDNYESGDSMASEERREMEENEIPVDGESIGSHTTEDEHDDYTEEEEEYSENVDSFIVSDNEELDCSADCNDDDEQMEDDINESSGRKKKTYKRLQRPMESSSSSNEEIEDDRHTEEQKHNNYCDGGPIENDSKKNANLDCPKEGSISLPEEGADKDLKIDKAKLVKAKSESNSGELIFDKNNLLSKYSENILDSSKLSDSALRLHCTVESEFDDQEADAVDNKENPNISRIEILRKLNQSDRFNKSVRDLNVEMDTSPLNDFECQLKAKQITENNNYEKLEGTSTPPDENASNIRNSRSLRSESHLGDVSVTSESDVDKENKYKIHERKPNSGLSISFGNNKKTKSHSKGRQDWQRSFTIDVTIKGGDLETEVTEVKLKENTASSSSLTSSPSSNDEQESEKVEGEDIRCLENIWHMPLPLGNPLKRTRRQSLALPTNPNMEICSSYSAGMDKKLKRKSLDVLSRSEFNPSQSFIDSIELHKSEINRQASKRKRLSKSFCGASDALDNSVVDIDVRHLHKRSKLMSENSIVESHQDSIENINSSKLSTKISSTPHEKTYKNDANINIQRILSRCDEILEAANRAKLEDKINKKQKKPRKNPDPVDNDDILRKVSKEIKHKDKTKTALSQAIKAADVILSKHLTKSNIKQIVDDSVSRQLHSDVLEAIGNSFSLKKKSNREIHNVYHKMPNVHTTSTSAGDFMEIPQTPEKKKKKPTYIQLPTGKVSVEPVTPRKLTVQAFNGAEFRESPITPYAVGFKVRQIPENRSSSSSKNGKRKRHYDEIFNERILPKSQWTQSGLFVEEDMTPKNCRIARTENKHLYGRSKKYLPQKEEQNVGRNFKDSAMMRPDIKRSTKRELLQLKERRQVQGHHQY